MCLVKVRPEEDVIIPNRVIRETDRRRRSHQTVVEAPAPPPQIIAPPPQQTIIEQRTEYVPQIIQVERTHSPPRSHHHHSPRQSLVSVQSREYRYEREPSPRQSVNATYRYVEGGPPPRHSAQRITSHEEVYERDRYGPEDVVYVNPRASTTSYRSQRERVVYVGEDGRRREYYR
jgi:hypothetical protein